MNWKDCYKNLIYTFFEWTNWVGPTALWIDYCGFTTAQNFNFFTWSPYLYQNTGDVSFLEKVASYVTYGYDGSTVAANTAVRRPTSSTAGYYRDCLVLDD